MRSADPPTHSDLHLRRWHFLLLLDDAKSIKKSRAQEIPKKLLHKCKNIKTNLVESFFSLYEMSFKAVFGNGAYNQNNDLCTYSTPFPHLSPPTSHTQKRELGSFSFFQKRFSPSFFLAAADGGGGGRVRRGGEEGKAIPSPREGGDWKWAPERQGCHFGRFYGHKKVEKLSWHQREDNPFFILLNRAKMRGMLGKRFSNLKCSNSWPLWSCPTLFVQSDGRRSE